jgi:hypothetical protein
MTVQNALLPSVQSAPRDRIVGRRFNRGRRCLRICVTGRSGRRCGVGSGLSMRDEFVVARSARPRRKAVRFASGPVRPMIGNRSGNLGARPESEAEKKRRKRHDDPLKYHATRWVVTGSAGDGPPSWRDCDLCTDLASVRSNNKRSPIRCSGKQLPATKLSMVSV